MAFQMSTLSSSVKFITSPTSLWRSSACVGLCVKFRHIFCGTLKAQQVRSFTAANARKSTANLFPGGCVAGRVERFSTTAVSNYSQKQNTSDRSPRWGISRAVCRVALGALGVTTATIACLHTSAPAAAMAAGSEQLKLDSAKGDWRKAKAALLSLGMEERRKHYRSSSYLELDNIPVWTPSQSSGSPSEQHFTPNPALDGKISLFSGDITTLEIDGIVNAANKTLLGGGGVDGAIHRVAGPLLRSECAELRGCETGEAKVTGGYGLPAKHVIHTVGPIVMGGVGEEERARLTDCYRNSLEKATQNQIRSVAFPCISTGVYGYPSEQAVDVALAAVRNYLDNHHDQLDRVIFCVFLPKDKALYEKNLPLYFPPAC